MEYSHEQFLVELAARVKTLRRESGISQRELVTEFGLHLGQLLKIEKGEAVPTQTLLKLSSALQTTLEELVQGLGQEPSKSGSLVPL